MAGNPVSHPPESESRVCTPSGLMQLRKKRNKSKKEPVWRSSTGASGLLRRTAWRIEVVPVPGMSNVATSTKAIITIPITLYGYGNGDDAEEGAPERRRDWREPEECKCDKERCRCEARSAYLFPNALRCSCRIPHPALSRRVGIHPHTPHPRSDSQDP